MLWDAYPEDSLSAFLGMSSRDHLGFESAVRYFCFRLVRTAWCSSSTTSSGATFLGHCRVAPMSGSPMHHERSTEMFFLPSTKRRVFFKVMPSSTKLISPKGHHRVTWVPKELPMCQTLFREFWVRPGKRGKRRGHSLVQ